MILATIGNPTLQTKRKQSTISLLTHAAETANSSLQQLAGLAYVLRNQAFLTHLTKHIIIDSTILKHYVGVNNYVPPLILLQQTVYKILYGLRGATRNAWPV